MAPKNAEGMVWEHIEMFDSNVLVRQLTEEELEDMKETLIIIPGTVEQTPDARGVVVAIGPGALNPDGSRTKMVSELGDLILYRIRSGVPMRENECNCFIVRQTEVLCRINRKLNA